MTSASHQPEVGCLRDHAALEPDALAGLEAADSLTPSSLEEGHGDVAAEARDAKLAAGPW